MSDEDLAMVIINGDLYIVVDYDGENYTLSNHLTYRTIVMGKEELERRNELGNYVEMEM